MQADSSTGTSQRRRSSHRVFTRLLTTSMEAKIMKREREDHKQMGQGAAGRLNEPPHSSSCHHDTAASSHDLPACFITTPPSVRGPHSPSQSRVSLPPHSQRAARLYARRHGDGHLHALTHSPLPPTPPAELRDDLARALAGGTRGHLGGGGGKR